MTRTIFSFLMLFLFLPLLEAEAQLTVSDAQQCFALLDHSGNFGESLKLNDILSSNNKNKITESQHHLKGRILLTITDNAATNIVTLKDGSFYINDRKEEIANDEIVFWLEYDVENKKISVKELVAGQTVDGKISKALANSIEWEQKSTEEAVSLITACYDMLDFVSGNIEKGKIPASVYDCNNKDYNPIYAKVFSYMSVSTALNDVMLNELKKVFPELNKLEGDPFQIEFAFFCGMYNGLINVLISVPDLLKLAISPFSEKGRYNNNKFLAQIDSMEIYNEQDVLLYGKGLEMGKIWYLIVDGISGQFNLETPCVTSEFIGSIAGPIIVMCVGDVAAGTGILSKIGSTAVKVLQMCDRISDPFQYMGMGLRFVKTSSGKLMATIINSTGDVSKQLDNGNFNVRVIINNAENSIDVNQNQLEDLIKAEGKIVNIEGREVRLALKNTVKSELLSKRKGVDGDFYRANKEAGFTGSDAPRGYTWHHLDDFDTATGECTMQLVKSNVHTNIPGIAHSGAVAQYKTYYINSSDRLLYTD